jgi:hypothetical protein
VANLLIVPFLHPSPKHYVYVVPRIVLATTALRLDLLDAVQQYMEGYSPQTSATTLAIGTMDLRKKIVDHLIGRIGGLDPLLSIGRIGGLDPLLSIGRIGGLGRRGSRRRVSPPVATSHRPILVGTRHRASLTRCRPWKALPPSS